MSQASPSSPLSPSSFIETYLPPSIVREMEAGAYQSLCQHLRERSDTVQNMALMTLSGFCRNCLAKWLVLEARRLANDAAYKESKDALDGFGYDEAAQVVYGASYADWKARHMKKVTDEQMKAYQERSHIFAQHDKSLLQARTPAAAISTQDYYTTQFSPELRTKMEAGAFRSLCYHLQERSDAVQNMALMTLAGFCRNCLAKWLVVQARRISNNMSSNSNNKTNSGMVTQVLDALGYEEAAEYVYGCTYADWKKRHQQKATAEQMEAFEASKHLHAVHDKQLLAPRADKEKVLTTIPARASTVTAQTGSNDNAAPPSSLMSNVCCQDVDAPPATTNNNTNNMLTVPPLLTPLTLHVGILTVSDRASQNLYSTGDLSGPAIESTIQTLLNTPAYSKVVEWTISQRAIVPDDKQAIANTLSSWAESGGCNLILTTGGTGFAPRDVTPEATLSVLDRECRGLLSWASTILSRQAQPLASLSRGVAGVCGQSVVCNVPGSPKGAAEVTELVLPLLLHAVLDLQNGSV